LTVLKSSEYAHKHIEDKHYDASGVKIEEQIQHLDNMVKTKKYERGRYDVEVKAEIERLQACLDHLRTQQHLLPGTGIEMTTTTPKSAAQQRQLKAASIKGSSLNEEDDNQFTMMQQVSEEPGRGWFGDVHEYLDVEAAVSGRKGAGIMLFHSVRRPPTSTSTFVLLVQKKNGTYGRQGPPKGGAHEGESPFETACREFEEESGFYYNVEQQDLVLSDNAVVDIYGTHYYLAETSSEEVFARFGRSYGVEDQAVDDDNPIVEGRWCRIDGVLAGDESGVSGTTRKCLLLDGKVSVTSSSERLVTSPRLVHLRVQKVNP